MKYIEDIYSVAKQLSVFANSTEFTTEVQKLNRLRTQQQPQPQPATSQQVNLQNALQSIDIIIGLTSKIHTENWSEDHEYVSQKLGLDIFIGEKGRNYLESYKRQLQTNPPSFPTLIQTMVAELNNFRAKSTQFTAILEPFDLQYNIKTINESEGIIEISFDGNVSIDNFKDAKEQMNDWFLTIEGYARLANVRREDFEIICITKNSPAKFKIKTTLSNTVLVLSIVTSILSVEKTIIENRLMIDKLKQNALIADSDFQKQFIEMSEKHLDEKVNSEIEKIVNQKMEEHKAAEPANGDVRTNLSKSIHNQYNFIVNGGNVSIQVLNGEVSKDVEKLNKTKDELKQIKDAYENQKCLMNGDKNEETDTVKVQ